MTSNTARIKYENSIIEILLKESAGLSEYDLLNRLSNDDADDNNDAFESNLILFRTHFMLFHSLYIIRDRLFKEQRGCLVISALKIRLLPYGEGVAGISEHDLLREYYLDLTNMEGTTAKDVDEMLGKFYMRLSNNENRQQALQDLGLKDPIDDVSIKQQYRRLAMEYHPDRGGCKERLQIINAAMRVLLGTH